MTVTIFVPRDAAALALGAEKVAKAIAQEIAARGLDAKLVRNGSRGMFWLEPLVEVERRRQAHRLWAGEARGRRRAVRCRTCSAVRTHALCLGRGRKTSRSSTARPA